MQLSGIRFEQRRGQEAQALLYGSILQYLPGPAIDAVIAHIDAETGNLDKARKRFEDLARDGFSSIPSGYAGPAFLQFAARACFELGDRERAGQLRTMLASFVNNPVVLPVVGFVVSPPAVEAAQLALLEDDLESASNYLAEAKEKGLSLESPLLNTNLDRTEALIELSRGGPENLERAGVLLKGALATLESHGLVCRAQLVRNDLKKLAEKLEQAPATTAKGKLKVVPKR